MKILVLDDMPVRHAAFAKYFASEAVTHVYTYDEARLAMEATTFDVAYLDHDLNDYSPGASMYGRQELTGEDVARYIAKTLSPGNRPLEVIIHSWNPEGARNMLNILRDIGVKVSYQPFKGTSTLLDPSE
jgi:hypothetical protein